MIRVLALVAIAASLLSCSSDVDLPQVTPLLVSLTAIEQQSQALKFSRGDFQVITEEVVLLDERRNLEIPLRLFYPSEARPFPVLLFSHGNWSDNTKYDNIIHFWVSHGYAVIAPYHADGGGMARGIFNSLRYGQLGLIQQRADDFIVILDYFPEFEQIAPDFSQRMDRSIVAATGHSFGAFTAQQMRGAAAFNPDAESPDQAWQTSRETRIKAVVAISPPGPMFDVITENSWQKFQGPALLTTGTWDVNAQFWPQWQLHKMSFDKAVPGDQFALVVEGADHYFGNLICRPERDVPPQESALAIVNDVSLVF
ncbi:MAG: hypothetical protein WD005_03515, partial [Haliea sp.]